jgi:hypothetical protein
MSPSVVLDSVILVKYCSHGNHLGLTALSSLTQKPGAEPKPSPSPARASGQGLAQVIFKPEPSQAEPKPGLLSRAELLSPLRD